MIFSRSLFPELWDTVADVPKLYNCQCIEITAGDQPPTFRILEQPWPNINRCHLEIGLLWLKERHPEVFAAAVSYRLKGGQQ